VAELPHIWSISCKRHGQVDLVLAQSESATLSNQSGIESCRGRFTELSRPPRRQPMRSANKVQMRFGASLPPTRRKATYLALRRIGITYQPASAASNLTPLLIRRQTPEVLLTRVGIMEPMVFYNEPTLREQFMPRFRYQGSLMGSHDSLTGRSL
jgi:hypothetical protein